MTALQLKTLEKLPKNRYNISKSMREAGYSVHTSKSGEKIKAVRNRAIEEGILPSKQSILDDFQLNKQLSLKEKDFSNHNRANEALARCQGMFTDNTINKTEITNKSVDDLLTKHRLTGII